MKHRTVALLLCALAIPAMAFATMTRPSEVIDFLISDSGHPRDFDAKMYLRATADDGTPVNLFAAVHGSSEGKTPQDLKITLHGDITATLPEGTLATGFDIMTNRQKLYVKLSRITATSNQMNADDRASLQAANKTYTERWFVVDASGEDLASRNFWQDIAKSNDLPVPPEQLQGVINQVIDAVFDLEVTRFRSGHSYLLTQKPHAVTEAVRVLAQIFAKADPENAELQPLIQNQISGMDLVNDPDLKALEEEINRSLQIRTKVDISNEGTFQFGRMYMTFALPEQENTFVSFEVSMQNRLKPVYLELPLKTEPLQSVFGDFLFLPSLNMPEVESPLPPSHKPIDNTETKPALSLPDRPVILPVTTTKCSPKGKVRGIDMSSQETCPGGRESRRDLRRRLDR